MPTQIKENRLANLKVLADEIGIPELAKRLGYNQPSYLYQIINQKAIQNGKPKNIGSNMARKIEAAIGKEEGWLDQSHSININGNNSLIGDLSNIVHGTQNNVSGDQNTNNFFQNGTPIEEARAILNDADAKFLVAMPLLSVDKGVEYATCPEKKEELLRSSSERVSIYMPHSDSTFAVKVPDNSLQGVVEPPIYANDILVIEPKIRPANNDLVLICLNHQQPNQRGIIAKIYVDLDDRCTIKYSSTQPETPLPESAVICGVHIKTTRYPFSNDIIASRIEPEWNIFNKIFNTNK